MPNARPARTISVLLLAQGALAPVVNFGLLAPVFAPPGVLINAAAHAGAIGLALLLGLASAALGLAVAIGIGPVLGPRGRPWALWLVALAGFGLALAAAEHIAIQALLSTSRAYFQADATGSFDAVVVGLTGLRRGAHFAGLLCGGAFALVLYAALGHGRHVPRALAVVGSAAALLAMIAVALPLFGQPIVLSLLAPLGLANLALVIRLFAKGLEEPERLVGGA
jgi:hypothetical protein